MKPNKPYETQIVVNGDHVDNCLCLACSVFRKATVRDMLALSLHCASKVFTLAEAKVQEVLAR